MPSEHIVAITQTVSEYLTALGFSICKMRRLYTLSNPPHMQAHVDNLGVAKAPTLGEPMGGLLVHVVGYCL